MSREEILKQLEADLRTIARNHKVDASIENPDEDGDFMCTLTGEKVPLVSDVRQLMEAYGLHHEDTVECDHSWGFTNILITDAHVVNEPSTMLRTLCGATRIYKD
jgi:hypothetical protein